MSGPGFGFARRDCDAQRTGQTWLAGDALEELKRQVPGWRAEDNRQLAKTFLFPDFLKALDFVNRVGAVAEQEGHHPDIHLAWGRVDVQTSTHDAGGLT